MTKAPDEGKHATSTTDIADAGRQSLLEGGSTAGDAAKRGLPFSIGAVRLSYTQESGRSAGLPAHKAKSYRQWEHEFRVLA